MRNLRSRNRGHTLHADARRPAILLGHALARIRSWKNIRFLRWYCRCLLIKDPMQHPPLAGAAWAGASMSSSANLQIVKSGIRSAAGDQSVCVPLSWICPSSGQEFCPRPNRGQAMRNHESSSSDHQVGQRLLHKHLRLRIQLRGRFVENQIGESFKIARAMAIRCRCPPLKRVPRSPITYLPARQLMMKSCASAAWAAAMTLSLGIFVNP